MFNAKVATEDELNQLLANNFPISDRPTLKMSGNRAFICYPVPNASSPGEWRIFFVARQVDGVNHIALFAPSVCFCSYKLSDVAQSTFNGFKRCLDNLTDLPIPLYEFIKALCRPEGVITTATLKNKGDDD